MGASHYGIYVYAFAWASALSLLATLGLDAASLRFLPQYRGTTQWHRFAAFLRESRRLTLAGSGILAILSGGALWALGDRLTPEAATTLAVAAAALPLLALLQLFSSQLRALNHVVAGEAPPRIAVPALVAGAVLLYASATGAPTPAPVGMAALLAFSGTAALGCFVLLVRRLPPAARKAEARAARERPQWLRTAFYLLAITGFHLLLSRTDVIMVGALLDTERAGIYMPAVRVAGLVAFGLHAVNLIAAPLVADLHHRGETADLQRVAVLVARGASAFAGVAFLLLVVGGRWILGLFGEPFTQGYATLLLLGAGQLANALVGSVGFLMSMTGHERAAAGIVGVSAAGNVALNAALIPIWGIEGAAVATSLTLVAWNVAFAVYVHRRLGVRSLPF